MPMFMNRLNNKIITVIAVAFAMFVDAMSYGIIVPLIPIYTDKMLNLNDTHISLFLAMYAIGLFVFVPFVYFIAKSIGNKNALLIGGLLLLLSCLIFPFSNNYSLLLFARFLQGSAAAITWTCGLSLVAQSVHPQHRSSALATAMIGVSIGHLIGAPFAGFMYEFGGIFLPFYTVGLITLLSMLVIICISKNSEVFTEKRTYNLVNFLKLTAHNKTLLALSGIVLLESFMLSYLEPSIALLASRNFNATSETIGLLFGTQVLTLALVSPIAAKIAEKFGKLQVIPFGMLASGLIFIFMTSSTTNLTMYFILMACLGIACAFTISPVLSAFADEIDMTDLKGLYHIGYGFINLIYSIGMLLSPSLNFFISDYFSNQISYLVIGFVLLASTPLFMVLTHFQNGSFQPYSKGPSHLAKNQINNS
ncbi:MFS transporter [Pigmentibacter sp. JX0631]|uniref:MFS transporter n=1 Tax=Pigmentibacter sp. JX0631 TaxID=2976982 RepID=UPI0024697697|nr:MFS transporter [Pigmentibacter sp. JX0631]WGL59557.1 MFS transporter [Pigmentibacter sp. JX0631]